MDHTTAVLPVNVKLKNRTLWFDGDSSIEANDVLDLLIKGISIKQIYVQEITDEVRKYNELADKNERISVKTKIRDYDFSWNIPDEYKNMNVNDYVMRKLEGGIKGKPKSYSIIRIKRVLKELKLYKRYGLMDVLRMLIYMINKMKSANIVWGIGRGSSVSSYVLYLIEVHDIDSVKYELDISEFMHII